MSEYEVVAARLFILSHPVGVDVTDERLSQELEQHGYHMSVTDLGSVLHRLQSEGLLRSATEPLNRQSTYQVTPSGKMTLAYERRALRKLIREILPESPSLEQP